MSELKHIKILYIEDDASSRLLVRKILNRPPFEYFEAATGLAGLEMATKHMPDLILMDINLPDISGNELTTKIKNTEELKNIVVVAISGQTGKHIKELTLLAGCDGFLSKPIDIKNFPNQLVQFVEGKKEFVDTKQKEFLHSQYEINLVDRLTTKVQELELSNQKLSSTSERLKDHTGNLEKILSTLTHLQTCSTPQELTKCLVDDIFERFQFDRCAFLDVDSHHMMMQIKYARGIPHENWLNFRYQFNSNLLKNLFGRKQVLLVRNLNGVEDRNLKEQLKKFGTSKFVFAYLGTPAESTSTADIRERVLPLLESFLPKLYDQQRTDIDAILDNLEEYFTSESLYKFGFIFLDNFKSEKRISSLEYRFLETLFRTASYMYQNLLLMEQLRLLFIRAEKEAITDPLTNLFNYRYFIQQLNREISRGKRHNSRFSLIMIDIDFFKDYNDTFGHQAGDNILKQIARLMMKNTRTSDIVARYGGEEFVIICPELNKNGAFLLAEKMRKIIAQMNLQKAASDKQNKLTLSLGIATFPDDGETAYQLIQSADTALYNAKETGRNKSYVFRQGQQSLSDH